MKLQAVKKYMYTAVVTRVCITGNPRIARFQSARSPVLEEIARIPLFNTVFIRKTNFL